MKKSLAILSMILAVAVASPALAGDQPGNSAMERAKIVLDKVKADKKFITSKNLALTDAESAAAIIRLTANLAGLDAASAALDALAKAVPAGVDSEVMARAVAYLPPMPARDRADRLLGARPAAKDAPSSPVSTASPVAAFQDASCSVLPATAPVTTFTVVAFSGNVCPSPGTNFTFASAPSTAKTSTFAAAPPHCTGSFVHAFSV